MERAMPPASSLRQIPLMEQRLRRKLSNRTASHRLRERLDVSPPLPAPRPHGEIRPVDEWANFLTHLAGFLFTLPAAAWLLTQLSSGTNATTLAIQVYCVTLVGLYAASTLSHAFHDPAWRRLFRTCDQAMIFLLIAGSFTPFGVAFHPAGWHSPLVITEWTVAVIGVCLCLYFRNLPMKLRLIYGALGWLQAFCLPEVSRQGPSIMLLLLVAAGLLYTIGTLFLILDRRVKYFHAVWHLSVIGGSTCHFFAVTLLLESRIV